MNETVRNVPVGFGPQITPLLVIGPWDHHRVTLVFLAALVPALGVSLYGHVTDLFPVFALSTVAALAWSWVFARLRRRPLGWDWPVTALTVAILMPATVPLWQQAMALSFGIVMGEQIFGGRGRNFLHPTVLALAFLMFSFPGEIQAAAGQPLAIAAGIGGLLLLVVRLVSWRVLAGIAIGVTASLMIAGEGGTWDRLATGPLIFAGVFLIADPVASASTNAGRSVYGFLAGMLVVVFGQAGGDPGSLRAVIFAALLAAIFAPLIDQAVIWLNVRRRRRRG
jgi:Na+-transporting NADH:ubiquinone oxidoreductase subunit B